MNGYEILGSLDLRTTEPFTDGYSERIKSTLPSIAGGIIGIAISGGHPFLGAILGSAIIRNAVDVANGSATMKQAAERVGSHGIAAIGSLVVPGAPLFGYLGGTLVGNAVFGAEAPSLDAVRSGKATIHRGMKGDSVIYVQGLVGAVADGDFGPNTEEAVKVFQKKIMVNVTGIVNNATLAGLDQLAGGTGGVAKLDFDRSPAAPTPTPPRPVASAVPATKPALSLNTTPAPSTSLAPLPTISLRSAKDLAAAPEALVIGALAGALIGGGICAYLWPAHRFIGFALGALFVGSPIGAAVGTAVAAKKLAA